MNIDLVGLMESSHYKSERRMNGLIELNGRMLKANEVREVVRASVRAGYKTLYEVPDEFAERVLNEKMNACE